MPQPSKISMFWRGPLMLVMAGLILIAAMPVLAQQITGVPGSPSATMTIQGDQIPAPPQKFGGKIERTTQGGRFAGYGFYVLKGKPVFLWNLVDLKRVKWEGPEVLSPGKHNLEFDFKYDGLGMGTLAFNSVSGIGRGGTGVLKVDGKVAAEQKMERTIPLILAWDENLDVGSDTGTPVNDQDYQVPFKFTGKIDRITLTIDRPKLTPEDEKKLMEAQRNNRVSE